MRKVAAGTFPFFHKWMQITTLESLLEVFMTFQADFPFGAGSEFECIFRVSRCGENEEDYNGEYKNSCRAQMSTSNFY